MFGLSFGTKKNSGTETQNLASSTDTTQAQTSNQNQSTTGTQNTSQTGTSSSSGSSATGGTTSTNETQTGTQTGTTKSLDSGTLTGLQAAVQQLLGGSGVSAAATKAVQGMSAFDPDSYVAGVNKAAASDSLSTLEESINGSASAIGGTAGTNSMSALLAGRLENNRAATLAGVDSQARATAQGMLAQTATAANQTQAQGNDLLTQLSGILKGATGETSTASTGSSTGGTTQASTTKTAEQQATAQNTSTLTAQDVLTQISSLLTGTEDKTGTSTTDSKGKTSGGGFTLGG